MKRVFERQIYLILIPLVLQDSKMKFSIGDRVEVQGYEDGLQRSYFSGTIIESRHGNDDYLVEYDNLLENENSSKKLKERVNPFFVRPEPPLMQDDFYKVHEWVDAYENDGWWFGTISRIKGSDYYVYFLMHEVEKAYKLRDLRVHHEWKDDIGCWVPCKVYNEKKKTAEKCKVSSSPGASSSKARPKNR
ncbi:hypothetical protein M9H77_14484 [Catharanthus roseus]|uniref:Uncharacterized protein n=1 Tax=Catharanthus roseus TaxID=4058 RepID=A0ACC0BN67_CATRO|nr:hypothetical protein M9H77_14484 [Catharanthus roseus]